MKHLFLLLFMIVSLAGSAQEQTDANKLLQSLVGVWKGKGTGFGKAVEDSIRFDTVLRSRFIFMRLMAVKGDDFIAEGYLWYNSKKQQVEFYEFNDGAWPVRILTGKAENNQLILEENVETRHIRITFVIGKDHFDLEEARLTNGKAEVFVKETFTRKK